VTARSHRANKSEHQWLLSAGSESVAHLVAQNAQHHTDTGVLDRHTSLIPRALGV